MEQFLDVFSTWNVIRSAGITAYFLLFLAVFAGITLRLPVQLRKWKAPILFIHQHAGWLAFLFSIVHGLLLLFDRYLPYTISEVFIPFSAKNEPLLSGLGTVVFYVILIVLLSSDFMMRIGKRVWKYLHMSTYPAFFIALLHGYFQGTSAYDGWGMLLYWITGSILIAVLVLKWKILHSLHHRDDFLQAKK